MKVRDADPVDIWHVVHGMRRDQVAENFATRFGEDSDELIQELLLARRRAIACYALCANGWDRRAIGIVGAWVTGPGLAAIYFVSTEEWPAIAVAATKWFRRFFVPMVLEPNVRRAELMTLASDTRSRRWLELLGFTEEGIAYARGKHGEDFVHVAWINPKRAGLKCATS